MRILQNNLNTPKPYNRDGFAVVPVYSEEEHALIESFARAWINRLLEPWTKGETGKYPLETYHRWSKTLGVDHGHTFRAVNRYTNPDEKIKNIILNETVQDFFKSIGFEQRVLRDEGLGWLGFRFIRPGMNDGYPFSCKAWGFAKGCVSAWIPVIGVNPTETLTLVPGSHLKEYEAFLPAEQKFTKGELRLAKKPEGFETYNPKLKKTEAIFYSDRTLHSEDVTNSSMTRLNLEFRISLQSTAVGHIHAV